MAREKCIILKEKNTVNLFDAKCILANNDTFSIDSFGLCCLSLPDEISNQVVIYKPGFCKLLIHLTFTNNTYSIQLRQTKCDEEILFGKQKFLGNRKNLKPGKWKSGIDLSHNQELFIFYSVNEVNSFLLEEFNFFVSKLHTDLSANVIVSLYLPGMDTMSSHNKYGPKLIGYAPGTRIYLSDTMQIGHVGWFSCKVPFEEILTKEFIVGVRLVIEPETSKFNNYILIGQYKKKFRRIHLKYLKTDWIRVIKNEIVVFNELFTIYNPNQKAPIAAFCKIKLQK